MKVLFLDFDGPLFPDRVILHHPANKKKNDALITHPYIDYWKMDEVAVRMLRELFEYTYFEIVVSSSWRKLVTKEEIETLFYINDFDIPLHKNWCTPYRLSYTTRAHDISSWLSDNEVQDYIILDDPASGDGLDTEHYKLKNVILVDTEIGITINDFQKMRDIVERW
jgi:hypothetical protein